MSRSNSHIRLRLALAALVVLLLCSASLGGAADEIKAVRGHTLRVYVEGVRNSAGIIGYLVFESRRGWPDTMKDAVRKGGVPAHQGTTIIEIQDLRPGDYGVLVVHDENRNRNLDRDWKGAPKEQWGMSNNPRAYLGAPSFERAKFHVSEPMEIHIVLK